jgi:4-amino-4-deoxy-L-arabinose transferase-like glycosyltransferase
VSSHPALLLLPLLVLLILIGLFFPEHEDDEHGYLELARNLAHGHYATGRPDALLDADPSYPDLWFGPGLPLALAGPVAADLPLSIVRLTGPLFLFLAVIVFFKLAQRSMSARAALVATWALGLYLPFYYVLPNIHSEPLAVLFVVLALYAIARVCEEGGRKWVVLGAVALSGLALTRVDYGWVLTIVLACFVVWWLVRRSQTARRLAAMVALGLVFCIPWLAYTTAETGRVFQWGNSGAMSLYWMSSPYERDLGDWQRGDWAFSDPNLAQHRPFFETLRGLTLAEQNAKLERRAVANIRDHPRKYLENVAANLSRMFFNTPYSYSAQRLSALYFALPNAVLLGAILFAGFVALRVRRALPPPAAPFAIFAGVSFGLHASLSAYPRMLMPIVPVIVWFAAVAIANHVRLVTSKPQAGG